MDWELTSFNIDRPGELAQVFHMEVLLGNPSVSKRQVVVVDGLVFRSGRIRINRESKLREELERIGISLDILIEGLFKKIVEATGKASIAQAV